MEATLHTLCIQSLDVREAGDAARKGRRIGARPEWTKKDVSGKLSVAELGLGPVDPGRALVDDVLDTERVQLVPERWAWRVSRRTSHCVTLPASQQSSPLIHRIIRHRTVLLGQLRHFVTYRIVEHLGAAQRSAGVEGSGEWRVECGEWSGIVG